MLNASSYPRFACDKLLALLLVTCLALLCIGTAATAQPFAAAAKSTPVDTQVIHAASLASASDRTLVSTVKALKVCRIKHPKRCSSIQREVQRAGHNLAVNEQLLAKLAHPSTAHASASSAATSAPVLIVAGNTLLWTRPGNVSTFVLVRKIAGQEDQYSVIKGSSTMPAPAPGQTVGFSVRTDVSGSAWSIQKSIAYPAPVAPAPTAVAPVPATSPSTSADTQTAPTIAVSGNALSWNKIGNVNTYVLVKKVLGQEAQYSEISGTSTTPTTAPGTTVHYSVRTAVEGSAWASEVSISYPKVETPPVAPPVSTLTAPTITVSANTLSWNKIGNISSYVLMRKVQGQEAQYSTISGTSTTPAVAPGLTVHYSVRTSVEGSAWASEASISYPKAPVTEETKTPVTETKVPVTETKTPVTETPPVTTNRVIGTNDGAGWGPAAAQTILAGHITWNRVEIGAGSNTLAQSLTDGFHVLGIVGNVDDNTPLSQVDPNTWAASVVSELQANPGITIAEAGNEMFLKGGQANPVQYGRLYLAAVNAMKTAGIHTPLLFDMFGDYPQGSWASPTSWSRDSTGGGWLRDAVNGVPGLAAAILANGMGTHPYGANGENSKDEYGTAAVAAEETIANTVLGTTPTIYITEFGFDLGRCGEIDGACSQTEQATKMSTAYKTFLTDPHVAGIFAYQSHDDGTGQWGYMNNDNTTRPTYNIISQTAITQGQ
jgi:hypothetical protein